MTLKIVRAAVVSALVLACVAIAIQPAGAHKAITSKYTYNDDVFPILRERLERTRVCMACGTRVVKAPNT
jgi:methionine-rich copper-binding protein CopC